jgi:hypothetical protein
MRVGYERGLSDRDRDGLREFREFQKSEAEKERQEENLAAYQTYVDDLAMEQRRVPVAYKVQPLGFKAWVALMPDEQDPALRAAVATYTHLQNQNWRTAQKQAAGALTDEQLMGYGFDLTIRPEYTGDGELRSAQGEDGAKTHSEFMAACKNYDPAIDFDTLASFFRRNSLVASLDHLKLAWNGLTVLALVPEKPPVTAPTKALNSYGVSIAPPNMEVDLERKRKKYREDIVIRDPRDGKGFTQYQIDHVVDADTYKRLVLGENAVPLISHVIKPGY